MKKESNRWKSFLFKAIEFQIDRKKMQRSLTKIGSVVDKRSMVPKSKVLKGLNFLIEMNFVHICQDFIDPFQSL